MTIISLILLLVLVAEVTYLIMRSNLNIKRDDAKDTYVDTSALMDGRIVTAAQTGFIPSKLVILRSVVNELQLLADQADPEKRSRARRGLDAIQELQESNFVVVKVIEDGALGTGGVDERLIDIAKAKGGSICTIDFNLNKAATALGVKVLNINELAGSIRMAFLPGETISMTLTQKGQSSTQAVGYLADGTMVVVDKAAGKIGETVEIEFIRSLQTAAGRMMFAKLLEKASTQTHEAKPAGRKAAKAPQRSGVDKESVNRKSTRASSTKASSRAPRNQTTTSSRRRNSFQTKEDSLIELVNNQ